MDSPETRTAADDTGGSETHLVAWAVLGFIVALVLLAVAAPFVLFGAADYAAVRLTATASEAIPENRTADSVAPSALTSGEQRILEQAIQEGTYEVQRGRHDPRSFPDALDGLLEALGLPTTNQLRDGDHRSAASTYIRYRKTAFHVNVRYRDTYA